MKKVITFVCLLMVCVLSRADVQFSLSGYVSNAAVKTKMEKNISSLLTEIDRAGRAGSNLSLSAINMEPGAKTKLNNFWNNLHLVCEETMPVSKCLNDHQGYQVRGIKVMVKPVDNTYDGPIHRELTISLDRNGVITGVRPALEQEQDVSMIMGNGSDVEDLAMRREILKWVEDFRNYYNERDLNSLNMIYSDDALIITGSVMKKKVTTARAGDYGAQMSSNVKYVKQTKGEYMDKMRRVFQNNKYINVKFDKITVMRHGSKPNIYGVTLKQSWKTSNYSDEGWLFLLWDFNDRDHPQIHVRTWQPEELVNKTGVFSLDDFFIP